MIFYALYCGRMSSARSSLAPLASERADQLDTHDMTDISSLPALPKARAGVETYIVPDGTCFLYDAEHDISYVLDQVGALVWDYCDGATAVDVMIGEIATLLPGDEGVTARVTSLLIEFASERLLEAVSEASEERPEASDRQAGSRNG